jgi:hypothetical protein
MPSGLNEFKKVVKDFRSVLGLATKGVVAAPLAALFVDFGPSWPSAMPVLTSVWELIVLILVFEFWYGAARRRQRRRMIGLGLLLGLSFAAYLLILSEYTTTNPAGGLVVHGYSVLPDVQRTIAPEFSLREALEGAEYDPLRVWTPSSVTHLRLAFLAAWFGMFGSLAAFVAVFVLNQRNRPVPSRPRPKRERSPASQGGKERKTPSPSPSPRRKSMQDETPGDVADRIDRHGDRYNNAGDRAGERSARDAADRARNAGNADKAREVERDFNKGGGGGGGRKPGG